MAISSAAIGGSCSANFACYLFNRRELLEVHWRYRTKEKVSVTTVHWKSKVTLEKAASVGDNRLATHFDQFL